MSQENDFTKSGAEQKRLYRSKSERVIAGVCGGLANYLNIDPVLVRVAFVLFTFFGGVGFFLYIIAWIIVPCDKNVQKTTKTSDSNRSIPIFWGILLIVIGAFLLMKQTGYLYFFRFWHIPWSLIWGVLLILGGGVLLLRPPKTETKNDNTTYSAGPDPRIKPKQVYRSMTNKMIAGVCGGVAEYFNIDATLVRIGYVLLTLASVGVGVVVYLLMALILSSSPLEASAGTAERRS